MKASNHIFILTLAIIMAAQCLPAERVRVETESFGSGAELVTIFRQDAPVLTVLRDTLGDRDPANDVLRDVWILSYKRPSIQERVAASIPLFYWRDPLPKAQADRPPKPVIDLAEPHRRWWAAFVGTALQSLAFDPQGVYVRASTRTYKGNASDQYWMQVVQANSVLEDLRENEQQSVLSKSELDEIQTRLMLTNRLLGGFVSDAQLPKFAERRAIQVKEMRGQNWELLRQRAEATGLYMESLGKSITDASSAMLWVARSDLMNPAAKRFDSRFLDIANPWDDESLRNWKGYSETWYFDGDQRRVSAGTPGARSETMIPLALYSLDHPHVPLLLADFRSPSKPARREFVRKATEDVPVTILGLATFGNWQYRVARLSWDFVRGRQGAAVDRSARIQAYSESRNLMRGDLDLSPELSGKLNEHLSRLALNPLATSFDAEANLARSQYQALLRYAQAPNGLAAKIERLRQREAEPLLQSNRRGWHRLGTIASLGIYRHREPLTFTTMALLDEHRRAERGASYLDQLLASTPAIDVVSNMDEVRHAVNDLEESTTTDTRTAAQRARLVSRVAAQTQNEESRSYFESAASRIEWRVKRTSPGSGSPAVPSGTVAGGN